MYFSPKNRSGLSLNKAANVVSSPSLGPACKGAAAPSGPAPSPTSAPLPANYAASSEQTAARKLRGSSFEETWPAYAFAWPSGSPTNNSEHRQFFLLHLSPPWLWAAWTMATTLSPAWSSSPPCPSFSHSAMPGHFPPFSSVLIQFNFNIL